MIAPWTRWNVWFGVLFYGDVGIGIKKWIGELEGCIIRRKFVHRWGDEKHEIFTHSRFAYREEDI